MYAETGAALRLSKVLGRKIEGVLPRQHPSVKTRWDDYPTSPNPFGGDGCPFPSSGLTRIFNMVSLDIEGSDLETNILYI